MELEILDAPMMEGYKEALGEDVLKELVQTYIEDTGQRIGIIRTLFDEKNYDQLGKEGHTIKGSSSNMGVLRVAEFGKILQTACEENNVPVIEAIVPKMEQAVGEALHAIQRYL